MLGVIEIFDVFLRLEINPIRICFALIFLLHQNAFFQTGRKSGLWWRWFIKHCFFQSKLKPLFLPRFIRKQLRSVWYEFDWVKDFQFECELLTCFFPNCLNEFIVLFRLTMKIFNGCQFELISICHFFSSVVEKMNEEFSFRFVHVNRFSYLRDLSKYFGLIGREKDICIDHLFLFHEENSFRWNLGRIFVFHFKLNRIKTSFWSGTLFNKCLKKKNISVSLLFDARFDVNQSMASAGNE